MSNQPAVIGPDGVARPYIGGQALLEGVMMRSPHAFAAVVRRKSGALVVREQPMDDPRQGVRAWPLVRGVTALVEALRLGSRSLRFAAEIYEQDLEEEEARTADRKPADRIPADRLASVAVAPSTSAEPKQPSLLSLLSLPIIALVTQDGSTRAPGPKPKKEGSSAFSFLSVLFALGLFIALPQASAAGITALFKLDLDVRSAAFQALTGAAKLIIIVGYMLAIRRIPEIRRVFQYHGAEHKSIYAYESGMGLSVENARSKTTLHPRCGTTFIVMVALVSVFVFSALGPLLPQFGVGRVADNVLFFLLKLPFLPVIAAVTFELQRFLARFGTRGPLSALLWPGFLVQKITTIEPDDKQLEVALGALAVTLAREQGRASVAEPTGDRTYPNYDTLLTSHA